MKKTQTPTLNTATLPATALAVRLMGRAANHPNAGTVTDGLFLFSVLAFILQCIATFHRA